MKLDLLNAAVSPLSRRDFLKSTSTIVAGTALGGLALERSVHAAGDDLLKVALIGCGGRGTGAAAQALATDGKVKLVAMADAFRDRLDGSLKELKAQKDIADRIDVPEDNKFVGFDSYKNAISLADVVVLATPPGFRPYHFEEAVKQGKHVFMEKPVAVDAPGVRKVLAAAEEAKKKNLKVGVGLQRRHQLGYLETMKRLHDGAIGDIVAMRCYWNDGGVWVKERLASMSEMEYQMRNWYYFVWLCGDHIVEQHIHNLDVINWVKNANPVRCSGLGGREARKGPKFGEIFDHHAVEFEYPDGSRCASQCRHIRGCWSSVSEAVVGTKGSASVNDYIIRGDNAWRFRDKGKNPYQQEHDDLFAAIRNDKPFNEAVQGAHSTLTAIMGRLATYSGAVIEWDKALNSNIDLMPERFAFDAKPKILPNADGLYPIAIPGTSVTV